MTVARSGITIIEGRAVMNATGWQTQPDGQRTYWNGERWTASWAPGVGSVPISGDGLVPPSVVRPVHPLPESGPAVPDNARRARLAQAIQQEVVAGGRVEAQGELPLDRSFDGEVQLMTAVGVDSLKALAEHIGANTKLQVSARHSADRRLVLAVHRGDLSRDFVVFFPITLAAIYRILEVKQGLLISFSTNPDGQAPDQKPKTALVPQPHARSIARHSDVVSSHREAAVPWLVVGGMVLLFLLFLGPGVVDDSRGVGYDCPSTVNMFLPGYKVINVNVGGAADMDLPLNAAYPNAHGVYYACRAKATWFGLAAFLVAAGAGTGGVLAVRKRVLDDERD